MCESFGDDDNNHGGEIDDRGGCGFGGRRWRDVGKDNNDDDDTNHHQQQ